MPACTISRVLNIQTKGGHCWTMLATGGACHRQSSCLFCRKSTIHHTYKATAPHIAAHKQRLLSITDLGDLQQRTHMTIHFRQLDLAGRCLQAPNIQCPSSIGRLTWCVVLIIAG